MHVYLRSEPIRLRMKPVASEGLVPEDAGLVGVAFFVNGNEQPSFRALLPPQTVTVLRGAVRQPVQIGVLAEEPENGSAEVHAMVGICVQIQPEDAEAEGDDTSDDEAPWQSSANAEAWKGEPAEDEGEEGERAALLTFAPLIRLQRRFPFDFGEELADLLESALAGKTRPVLEARVDQLLGDL